MKKRKDGRWIKKVIIEHPDKTKEPKYFYSTASTEREATNDITNQILNYKIELQRNLSFKILAQNWNKEYRAKIPDTTYKKNIKAAYERILEEFKHIKNINDLTAVDINVFIKKLIARGYYKKTIATHKSVLNMICTYAILSGYIKSNPVSDIRLPGNLPKGKRSIPKTDELKIITNHHEGFDLLPYFFLYSGCRKSEALAITDNDIDFENKVIKIRNHVIHDGNTPIYESVLKTDDSERDIILLDRLANVIPRNFKGFLFSMNDDGKNPLTKSAYDKRWDKYRKKYGVSMTAHQLRHAYATMLFEAGVDVKDAQALMGHSDINLTKQIYTHIRDERRTETAKKLNEFSF